MPFNLDVAVVMLGVLPQWFPHTETLIGYYGAELPCGRRTLGSESA